MALGREDITVAKTNSGADLGISRNSVSKKKDDLAKANGCAIARAGNGPKLIVIL